MLSRVKTKSTDPFTKLMRSATCSFSDDWETWLGSHLMG